MKIQIMADKKKPVPTTPSVSLSHEAYETLLALSYKLNVSMRKIASAIILSASEDVEIIDRGEEE